MQEPRSVAELCELWLQADPAQPLPEICRHITSLQTHSRSGGWEPMRLEEGGLGFFSSWNISIAATLTGAMALLLLLACYLALRRRKAVERVGVDGVELEYLTCEKLGPGRPEMDSPPDYQTLCSSPPDYHDQIVEKLEH